MSLVCVRSKGAVISFGIHNSIRPSPMKHF